MRLPILAAVFTSGACACVFAAPAFAHSPYLLPNAFDATGRDHVTVEGSFTERFFTPDVVMKSDSFAVVGPDGAVQALKPAYFRDLTVLETDTKQDGTWRITSGQRVGRTADAAFVKDASGDGWVFFDPEKGPPAGAKAVKMTSLTKAEVYVSRGKPSDKPLAPTGQGWSSTPSPTPIRSSPASPRNSSCSTTASPWPITASASPPPESPRTRTAARGQASPPMRRAASRSRRTSPASTWP